MNELKEGRWNAVVSKQVREGLLAAVGSWASITVLSFTSPVPTDQVHTHGEQGRGCALPLSG